MTPLEDAIRIEGGRVVATLIRLTGDFGVAEDAVQEASIVALEQWRRTGIPDNPAAWLNRVARNRALDHLRREAKRKDKETEAMRLLTMPADDTEASDPLRLLFTCCHPALSPDGRIALTLRTISQLSTREIARALLEPEPTVAQRISRAKRKIRVANIPYRVPGEAELPDRLPGVLQVLYLAFTAGYSAYEGAADGRVEIGDEAIRLTRTLVALMPDEPEVRALLALMLATWSRRATRLNDNGELVLLADQDRAAWDTQAIVEAQAILGIAPGSEGDGWYRIQAAIALEHSSAKAFDQTDWSRIVDLYARLEDTNPSAVVRVNRAVAVAHDSGPDAGLALLDDLDGDPAVESWHLFWSTRAELLARTGDHDASAACLRRALECAMNDADRHLLTQRLAVATEM